jgi:hypothetical protein
MEPVFVGVYRRWSGFIEQGHLNSLPKGLPWEFDGHGLEAAGQSITGNSVFLAVVQNLILEFLA